MYFTFIVMRSLHLTFCALVGVLHQQGIPGEVLGPPSKINLLSIKDTKLQAIQFRSFVGEEHQQRPRPSQPVYFDLTATDATAWQGVFASMEEEIKTNDGFTRDSLFYSVSSLLVNASRLTVNQQSKGRMAGENFLFTFQELIEEHYLTLKTPRDYAEKMNITPNYLNVLCKKKSGKSAGELIRQRIVLEAKRLLAHTQLSVLEIAYKLGFQDNSYFGRFFKKYTRLTPEAFRSRQVG